MDPTRRPNRDHQGSPCPSAVISGHGGKTAISPYITAARVERTDGTWWSCRPGRRCVGGSLRSHEGLRSARFRRWPRESQPRGMPRRPRHPPRESAASWGTTRQASPGIVPMRAGAPQSVRRTRQRRRGAPGGRALQAESIRAMAQGPWPPPARHEEARSWSSRREARRPRPRRADTRRPLRRTSGKKGVELLAGPCRGTLRSSFPNPPGWPLGGFPARVGTHG